MKVLKVPYNAGNIKDKDGIELGPDLIEKAVKDFYLNESGFLPVIDFDDVKIDNGSIEDSHRAIEEVVSNLDSFSVVLGGDHSITLPSFKGFAKGKENPGIIVFDAHPDLMHPFDTHEDYLRSLIEQKVLKPENVVLVGLRNCNKEEDKFMKDHKIKRFSMKELSFEGRREVCDAVMAAARNWSDLYVSIDIDVLDPAFAPGTGYCEPGGLSTRELLYFIHRLKNMKNWRMADLVEVNPKKDVNGITVQVGAKIITELS